MEAAPRLPMLFFDLKTCSENTLFAPQLKQVSIPEVPGSQNFFMNHTMYVKSAKNPFVIFLSSSYIASTPN